MENCVKTLEVEGVHPMTFESDEDGARYLPRFSRRLQPEAPTLGHLSPATTPGGPLPARGVRSNRRQAQSRFPNLSEGPKSGADRSRLGATPISAALPIASILEIGIA